MPSSTPSLRAISRTALFFCLLWFCGALPVSGQAPFDIPAHYTKREVLIPMRDGIRLFTSIYLPKDASRKYPIMFDRTPYAVSPYGEDKYKTALGPSRRFMEEGFIFVYQDVRGRLMSEGDFLDMRPETANSSGSSKVDESTDTYDTIDWLVKNLPNNNGRVGMWGISYPGFYTATGAINSHPALKAVSPQAPIADWFVGDDFHHNGALYLLDGFSFLSFFGPSRSGPSAQWPRGIDYSANDVYKFFLELGPLPNVDAKYYHSSIKFWNDMMAHGTYDDFWKERNLLPHLRGVKAAVMTVGGWYDAEDFYGPLHIFANLERKHTAPQNSIVIGPWSHGGWSRGDFDHFGDIPFGSKTGEYYREHIEFPFFNYYLKGIGNAPTAKAQVFMTGANEWKTFAKWPPDGLQTTAFYLHANKAISTKSPSGDESASDQYVSDPANPVPYTPDILPRRKSEYMIEDQRFASARADVLSFQTEPFAQPMTLAGPLTADLFVATSTTDADFIVKVIDVYPDDALDATVNGKTVHFAGYQQMVRAEVMRGKFRNSYEKPEAFVPNQATEVKFGLNDICHTFLKGHRLMVQVQSSWFPLVDRNPQTFCDIYHASPSDFQKATVHLFHAPGRASAIRVGLLPLQESGQ